MGQALKTLGSRDFDLEMFVARRKVGEDVGQCGLFHTGVGCAPGLDGLRVVDGVGTPSCPLANLLFVIARHAPLQVIPREAVGRHP